MKPDGSWILTIIPSLVQLQDAMQALGKTIVVSVLEAA